LLARHEQSIPLRDFMEGYPWADLKIGRYKRTCSGEFVAQSAAGGGICNGTFRREADGCRLKTSEE